MVLLGAAFVAFDFGDEDGDELVGGARLIYVATDARNNANNSGKRFFNSCKKRICCEYVQWMRTRFHLLDESPSLGEFLLMHRKLQTADASQCFDDVDQFYHLIQINTMKIKCPKSDQLQIRTAQRAWTHISKTQQCYCKCGKENHCILIEIFECQNDGIPLEWKISG